MRLAVAFFLLISTLLSADIYDEYQINEDTNKSKNYFFSDDFDEIIHFDAILFEDNNVSVSGLETLEKITQKIDAYQNTQKKYLLTIIGHTRVTTDDTNEKRVASNTYANKIQDNFRDSFTLKKSIELSKNYMKIIEKYLLDNGVKKNLIVLEYRGGLDPAFTDETKDGINLSNRVMVSLYVEENLDLDNDGVVNSRDFCPETKIGIKVKVNGCKP